MTPSARARKLCTLAARLDALADRVRFAAEAPNGLAQLKLLHETARELADIRERFADGKGASAAAAKASHTHEAIAAELDVSKPYVQQMVYRGRALDS